MAEPQRRIGGKPRGLLARLAALVAAVVGLVLTILVGWVLLAAVIGFLVVAALIALVRAWWRGDKRVTKRQGRTVVDITPGDERRR